MITCMYIYIMVFKKPQIVIASTIYFFYSYISFHIFEIHVILLHAYFNLSFTIFVFQFFFPLLYFRIPLLILLGLSLQVVCISFFLILRGSNVCGKHANLNSLPLRSPFSLEFVFSRIYMQGFNL